MATILQMTFWDTFTWRNNAAIWFISLMFVPSKKMAWFVPICSLWLCGCWHPIKSWTSIIGLSMGNMFRKRLKLLGYLLLHNDRMILKCLRLKLFHSTSFCILRKSRMCLYSARYYHMGYIDISKLSLRNRMNIPTWTGRWLPLISHCPPVQECSDMQIATSKNSILPDVQCGLCLVSFDNGSLPNIKSWSYIRPCGDFP